MAYSKTILCLAASRRPGGRCFAGKEILPNGIGSWIRPVGANVDAISDARRLCRDGTDAHLLDKLTMSFAEHRPDGFQTENHVMASEPRWERAGRATWEEVVSCVDETPDSLWGFGYSTYHGINDKVPEDATRQLGFSLLLLRLNQVIITVAAESRYGGGDERNVRAKFKINKTTYKLPLTDIELENYYKLKEDRSYTLKNCVICVSLSKIKYRFAFKLVASFITPERAG